MEPLPTVEEIYRDEICLNKSNTADLKTLVKLFRKAYEKLDGVDITSEPMKLSSSKEIRAMAVKCLEGGIAADPKTKQKEVPAANILWVRERGSFVDYRRERSRILATLSRLFARQNRYRRNVNARGEQRPSEAGDALPSVEDSDMPDVDEILQPKESTRPKNNEGETPQTRSGKPYNNDPLFMDTSSSGANDEPIPFAAPVATMTQGLNWASSGIDSKPPKDLTSEKISPGTSAKHTMVGKDLPAEQPPQTTSRKKKYHAYVTSSHEDSDNGNSLNQDSALAEALAATTDVTQNEVERIIDDAIRQMDAKEPESQHQEKPVSPGQPPSEDRMSKRKRPEPVEPSHETPSDEKNQSAEARTSGDKGSTVGERVVKRPKIVNKISDAYKISKPQNDRAQVNSKPNSPRRKVFSPAQHFDSTVSSLASGTAPSEAGLPESASDAETSPSERRLHKRRSGISTKPRLASRMRLSRQESARRGSHMNHQDISAPTLPPSSDGMVVEKPKAHESLDTVPEESATAAMDMQGPHPEVAQMTSTEDFFRGRGHREVSQTLEPEPRIGRAVLEHSPTQSNEAATSPRKPRIAVQLWILEARVPRIAWTQWANASLNAQTVSTIFQAVDQMSQFKHVDTAHVIFQTAEQSWTYTIRKDDPDQFEDMKRSITADIIATTRRNRNNNNDFKIFIEPIGGGNIVADETLEEAEDEIIPGLY